MPIPKSNVHDESQRGTAKPLGYHAYIVALGLWLILTPLLGALYLTIPPSPDQSQFDYMAWLSTQGRPYYAGSFDMNWPGAMILHEIGIRVFGSLTWTWRLTDFLLMQSVTLSVVLLLHRVGFALAGLIFAVLYPVLYVSAGGWMAGQRDILATGFLLAAATLSLPGHRREGSQMLAAGALVAMAVLLRPTFLSYLAGLMLLEVLPLRMTHPRRISRIQRAGLLGLGFCLLITLVALAGNALGNLDDWIQQSFVFGLSVYAKSTAHSLPFILWHQLSVSWHWLTIFGILGAILWAIRDGWNHALLLVLGAAATILVSYVVQGKGFGYHLGGLLPILMLLSAVTVDQVHHTVRQNVGKRRLALTAILVLVIGTVTAGSVKKLANLAPNLAKIGSRGVELADQHPGFPEAEKAHIISLIRRGSTPTDPVQQYGRFYDVLYRAARLPSHRFITPGIDLMPPDFELQTVWLREIKDALRNRPPVFVLLDRSLVNGETAGKLVPKDPDRKVLDLLTTHLHQGYEIVFVSQIALLLRAKLHPET